MPLSPENLKMAGRVLPDPERLKSYPPATRLWRRVSQLRRRPDVLLTLLLVLPAVINFARASSSGAVVLPELNYLDGSWRIDLAFKAQHGVWVGRDQAFTYGPLYQYLWSLASRLRGFSLGSFFGTYHLFPYLSTLLLTYGMAALLLRAHAAWKRSLYIAALFLVWSPADVRPSLAVFAFSFFLWQVESLTNYRAAAAWRGVASSFVLLAAFLLSADTGVYSLASLSITVSCAFIEAKDNALR